MTKRTGAPNTTVCMAAHSSHLAPCSFPCPPPHPGSPGMKLKQGGRPGSASRSPKPSPGSGGGGVGLLDKLLLPRLENYAMNNSLDDIDEVAEALRSTYREYQRRQFGSFKQMVSKAVRIYQSRNQGATEGAGKPELKLQVRVDSGPCWALLAPCAPNPDGWPLPGLCVQAMEERHLSSKSRKSGSEDASSSGSEDDEDSGSSSGDSSSGSGSSSSDEEGDSDDELDAQEAAAIAEGAQGDGGLNNSILSMYARSSAAPGEGGRDGQQPDDDARWECMRVDTAWPACAATAAFLSVRGHVCALGGCALGHACCLLHDHQPMHWAHHASKSTRVVSPTSPTCTGQARAQEARPQQQVRPQGPQHANARGRPPSHRQRWSQQLQRARWRLSVQKKRSDSQAREQQQEQLAGRPRHQVQRRVARDSWDQQPCRCTAASPTSAWGLLQRPLQPRLQPPWVRRGPMRQSRARVRHLRMAQRVRGQQAEQGRAQSAMAGGRGDREGRRRPACSQGEGALVQGLGLCWNSVTAWLQPLCQHTCWRAPPHRLPASTVSASQPRCTAILSCSAQVHSQEASARRAGGRGCGRRRHGRGRATAALRQFRGELRMAALACGASARLLCLAPFHITRAHRGAITCLLTCLRRKIRPCAALCCPWLMRAVLVLAANRRRPRGLCATRTWAAWRRCCQTSGSLLSTR